MKCLLLATLCLFTATSFAANKERKMEMKMESMSFEDAKKMKLEMIDKKTALVQDDRQCVNDSKDKDELNKCMKKSWEHEREMKNDWKEEMKADMKDMKKSVKEKI